jgi:hypothetical protein
LAPELQILAINAAALATAYLGLYPGMGPLSNTRATKLRLMRADALVSVTALATAGALFWGTGTRFRLLLFDVNWFWFALATLLAMELPLMLWFFRRHGLTADLDDDP